MNVLAWILSFVSLLTVTMSWIYSGTEYLSLLNIVGQIMWSLSIGYMVFACHRGYGGQVKYFLSHPLWQPFSKLSYAVYIVHFPLNLFMQNLFQTIPYVDGVYVVN